MSNRIIPLLIVSVLLLIIDQYIYRAIVSIRKKKNKKVSSHFRTIWWGYSIFLIVGVFASIFFNVRLTLRAIILVAFFITFVSKAAFIPFLFVDDIRRGIVWIKRKVGRKNKSPREQAMPEEKINRSEFLMKAGFAVAAIPFASLSWGIASGAYNYQVKRRTLILPNLPKAFDGITFAQISDVHSGSFYNPKAVLGGVEMLLAEKPEFVFFTGDLVNNKASEMKDYQDIFSKIKAPLGVYSTLGNHDYGDYFFGKEPSPAKAKNLSEVIATHERMGWDLLMNENRRIKVDGEEIGILGVENWGTGRFPKYGRFDLATKDTDDMPIKLLLSHDPSSWRNQVLANYPQIDATFSGHTHGMQFGVAEEGFQWSPVQYVYPEWSGLYQEGRQQLYVNVGYGFLGYPGRVGILPEITIFELKQA